MTADAVHEPVPHRDGSRVSIVDGNALAGMLRGLFAVDPTIVTLACGHCARSGPLAETIVERDGACAIVRCRACTRTLMVVESAPGEGVRVRIAALAELQTAPPVP